MLYFCSEAIRYSFGPVIQKQLAELVFEWNHHHIRHCRNVEAPGGVPEELYFIPEQTGTWTILSHAYNSLMSNNFRCHQLQVSS